MTFRAPRIFQEILPWSTGIPVEDQCVLGWGWGGGGGGVHGKSLTFSPSTFYHLSFNLIPESLSNAPVCSVGPDER